MTGTQYSASLTSMILNCPRTVSIDVSEQPDGSLRLKFSDNGCGIPDENRSKIFDPFFTTRRYEGGTGLGLNILYNLVSHKMHGTVSLSNRHENGATFVINLPKIITITEVPVDQNQ